MFEGGEEKSRRLSQHYQRVALEYGCEFMDTAPVVVSSDLDGIHWAASEHKKLGQAVAMRVKAILG
jgi:hypothetical protein